MQELFYHIYLLQNTKTNHYAKNHFILHLSFGSSAPCLYRKRKDFIIRACSRCDYNPGFTTFCSASRT